MNNYLQEIKQLIKNNHEIFAGQNKEILKLVTDSKSDINEHLPTLIKYGQMVDHITEMGVRWGYSTRAFLFSRPRKLISIDKFEWNSIQFLGKNSIPGNSQYKKYKRLYRGYVDFIYILADSTKIELEEETDLLFIDTLHHKKCLEIELNKHAGKSRRFIILHDTQTYGETGQANDDLTIFDQITTKEPGSGLKYAIQPFLKKNRHWKIKEIYTNNNGLTVLERV